MVDTTSSSKNQSEAKNSFLPYMRPDTQNDLYFLWSFFLLQFTKREVQNRKRKMERTGLVSSPNKFFKTQG